MTASLSVAFTDRLGVQTLLPDTLVLTPSRYSWSVTGGPLRADLTGSGNDQALWELMGWLRYGMIITDENGNEVWWGYVHEVAIQVGYFRYAISLDRMANLITVAYGRIVAGEETSGDRATTVSTIDLDSSGEYGIKEALLSLPSMTDEAADLYRDNALNLVKSPRTKAEWAGSSGMSITVTGWGWWQSLGWRLYTQAADAIAFTGPSTADGLWKPPLTVIGQSFVSPSAWRMVNVHFKLRKVGSPTERMRLSIMGHDAVTNQPNATTYTTSDRLMTDAPTTSGWMQWDLPPFDLIVNQRYWLVLTFGGLGGGAVFDATNFIEGAFNGSDVYSGGTAVYKHAAGYIQNVTVDYLFRVGGLRETTSLIEQARAQTSQFLGSSYIESPSGVYASAYVDGDVSTLTVIEEWLSMGSMTALRLLATVNKDRSITIWPQPLVTDITQVYLISARGEISNRYGLPVPAYTCPVGVWFRLKDAIPASVNLDAIGDPTTGFVDEFEYTVETDTFQFQFQGQIDVLGGG